MFHKVLFIYNTFGIITQQKKTDSANYPLSERQAGFEPVTLGLGSRCSTTELLPQIRGEIAPLMLFYNLV